MMLMQLLFLVINVYLFIYCIFFKYDYSISIVKTSKLFSYLKYKKLDTVVADVANLS